MSNLHEEEALGKAYDSRLMRRLLQYMKPYKWRVALALVMVAIVTPLELAPPLVFQKGIDKYFVPELKGLITEASAWSGIGWLSLLLLAVLTFDFLAQYIQIRIMQRVGQQTMYDMRREIFGHMQRLPMSYFDRNPVGRLVTRVTTDVDALNDLFAAGVVTMINDFFLLVVMAVLLFKIDRRLALDTLAVLPGILIVTMIFRKFVRDANRRIRTAIARINAFLQEYISGMSVVQLFNRERKAMDEFEKRNRDNMLAWRDAILAYALFYPAVEFLSFATIALIYWSGGNRILSGGITLGVLTAFTMFAQRFFRPIQDLSEKFNILQSAMAASERIFKLLDEPVLVESDPNAIPLDHPRGEIEFRNVWFSYRRDSGFVSTNPEMNNVAEPADEDWVLRDVSFRVEPGQTIAIVGHTGAGKTTLISLLLRFYDVQRGQILLDGKDIRTIELQDLRRQFGIVLQDPFLFTGTIETNIRLGTPNIDRATVERAVEEIGLGEFIRSLPEGVASNVNERGSTLSVGQRQLINFARALAHNPRFLILDEATSSVDTKTELLIREALNRLLSGRTALVIAHRLSTIQHADRILVFHKGRLREQGAHQELLSQRGIYYRLYQLQYKEQELHLPIEASRSAEPSVLPASD
ncbi:MAG: antibiotic ABC transporter ATP-binding protein [Acidobacteria bacterium 13_2_20CM_57_17]|nr:MAG: antibiotic ABC transporter ATP-binding protein [Acidobacteria bacterium 13_2_20CM_57_17]OLB93336.1 MAG: antibiotic ABC transporter ATP-binding protein [Acidobacteria bacterium 13_2_20CM_2_57_12]